MVDDFLSKYWPIAAGAVASVVPYVVTQVNSWRSKNDADNEKRVSYWQNVVTSLEAKVQALERRVDDEQKRGRDCDVRAARLEGELRWVTAQLNAAMRHDSASAPVCVVTTDQKGIILDADGAWVQLFGYRPTELIGKSCSLLLPENAIPEHEKSMANAAATNRVRTGAITGQAKRKDGSLFAVVTTVRQVTHDNEPCFFATITKLEEER
jgi:PAS domain S-box-containing protein